MKGQAKDDGPYQTVSIMVDEQTLVLVLSTSVPRFIIQDFHNCNTPLPRYDLFGKNFEGTFG